MPRDKKDLNLKGTIEMPLTFRERQSVIRELANQYKGATKRDKGLIIDHLHTLTDFNCSYAARVLRTTTIASVKGQKTKRSKAGRKCYYHDSVLRDLRHIWAILDFTAGKRLAPFLPEIIAVLENHGELEPAPEVRAKLFTISSATIDRLLVSERKRLKLNGRTGTKPGSLLKNSIPSKIFTDWNDTRPGFIEIDLVGHDGGILRDDFAQTLDAVDVATGWMKPKL